jgi:hypothetical protein
LLLPFGVAIAVEQDSSGVLVRWRCEERIFNKTKKNNPTQKIINCDRKGSGKRTLFHAPAGNGFYDRVIYPARPENFVSFSLSQ